MGVKKIHPWLLLAGILWCGLLSFVPSASAVSVSQPYVEAMPPGWNLGNTLGAIPTETFWVNLRAFNKTTASSLPMQTTLNHVPPIKPTQAASGYRTHPE